LSLYGTAGALLATPGALSLTSSNAGAMLTAPNFLLASSPGPVSLASTGAALSLSAANVLDLAAPTLLRGDSYEVTFSASGPLSLSGGNVALTGSALASIYGGGFVSVASPGPVDITAGHRSEPRRHG